MRIGAGIALIVIGAVIAFAVRDTSDTFNLTALGIIIMLGGAAGIWLSYHLANRRTHVDREVMDVDVERQYRTEATSRVAEDPIDVTPPQRGVGHRHHR
ncbi:hypothetical protein EV137_1220 [Kribbella pratensis]|jgi:hypothetical protein|uniref:DUF6458 domain-containing protein n=1 Tax=Kribbella pratensis TaxID=2512112 RepID=A0ABY2FLV9_9ACTN|nr:DUF6458 family protein [Kribbella pratensis]TDW93923.1 hypothetical protein EV137_1220 [Kribbella pratensis]